MPRRFTHLVQTQVEDGAGAPQHGAAAAAHDLGVVVEEDHGGGAAQPPLQRGDGLALQPRQVSLGVRAAGEREQQLGGRGAVLLHLGRQVQAGEGQQLHLVIAEKNIILKDGKYLLSSADLLLLDLDLAQHEVEVGHGQVQAHVAEAQVLAALQHVGVLLCVVIIDSSSEVFPK